MYQDFICSFFLSILKYFDGYGLNCFYIIISVTRSKKRLFHNFNIKDCFVSIEKNLPTDCLVWLNEKENEPKKIAQRRGTVASSSVRFVDGEIIDIGSDYLHPVPINYTPIIQQGPQMVENQDIRRYLKIGSLSCKKPENSVLAAAGASEIEVQQDSTNELANSQQSEGAGLKMVSMDDNGSLELVIVEASGNNVEPKSTNELANSQRFEGARLQTVSIDFNGSSNTDDISHQMVNLSIDGKVDYGFSASVATLTNLANDIKGKLAISDDSNAPMVTADDDKAKADDHTVKNASGNANQVFCPFSRSRNPPFARGGRRRSMLATISPMETIPETFKN